MQSPKHKGAAGRRELLFLFISFHPLLIEIKIINLNLLLQLLKLRDDHLDILGNSNTVQQGIDVVVENINWMNLHQEEVGIWLAELYSPIQGSTTTSTPAPPSAGSLLHQMNAVLVLAAVFIGNLIIC